VKRAFFSPESVEVAVPEALEHLAADGVIAYPTETVYGLGTRVTGAAIAALDLIKGREPGKPLLMLIGELSMAARLGLEVRVEAARLAAAFWPGPLTLVLPSGDAIIPPRVQGATGGVAVRQSSHPGAAALVAALDGPLISTSANRAGQPTPTDADGIESEFATVLDQLLVLDGGRLPPSAPSTVVDLCGRVPVLVREGAIAWNDVKKALSR
jgi:L-threonylcarbamoyladenylate synthase